jgi:hypothetical protein
MNHIKFCEDNFCGKLKLESAMTSRNELNFRFHKNRFELGYNVMKGTEYFVSLLTSVVITEDDIVMVNSQELIGTTENLTL